MEHIQTLCQAIDEMMGRKMQSPKDFDLLNEAIYSRLHEQISPSTQKRLWGYLDNSSEPRRATLDVLARFIGYNDYAAYVDAANSTGGEPASSPVVSRHLNVQKALNENDVLRLTWAPGRICYLRYLGNLRFRVEQSVNTRLQPGDTFLCGIIVEGEPLYLSDLQQPGRVPTNYVCGKLGGIRFELL